jgi:Tfp pilus assembly protein PilN
MLRTNLATRPFYNERAVRTALVAVAVLALGLTLFNAFQIVMLRGQSSDARQTVSRNDASARDLRDKAQVIRRAIDRTKLDAVQAASQEANALIDRRTFSWTELLNQFESTLPPDVRVMGVVPQVDPRGRRLVAISILSRRVEDVEAFMDALEKTGAFHDVLSRSEIPDEGGTMRSELQAYYEPGAAAAPPAASEPGKDRPANQTAGNVTPGGPQ